MTTRFTTTNIYEKLQGPYDDDNPQFDCVRPALDDNGQFSIVDCWIVDRKDNIHPGYNVSPVPIPVSEIGNII